jgi:hypothetical protein
MPQLHFGYAIAIAGMVLQYLYSGWVRTQLWLTGGGNTATSNMGLRDPLNMQNRTALHPRKKAGGRRVGGRGPIIQGGGGGGLQEGRWVFNS